MLIAIDIDEVLAETVSAFVKKYNQIYKTNLKRSDFYTFDWWKVIGISFEEFKKRYGKMIEDGFFKDLKPKEGAPAGVKALAEKYALIAVTARPRSLATTTEEWLEKYFPHSFLGVEYTREKPLSHEIESKFSICRRRGVNILIEDDLEYAEECAENGIKVFLFDAPWNQHLKETAYLIRVYSWPEIVKELL